MFSQTRRCLWDQGRILHPAEVPLPGGPALLNQFLFFSQSEGWGMIFLCLGVCLEKPVPGSERVILASLLPSLCFSLEDPLKLEAAAIAAS